jgi:hypothetical protein
MNQMTRLRECDDNTFMCVCLRCEALFNRTTNCWQSWLEWKVAWKITQLRHSSSAFHWLLWCTPSRSLVCSLSHFLCVSMESGGNKTGRGKSARVCAIKLMCMKRKRSRRRRRNIVMTTITLRYIDIWVSLLLLLLLSLLAGVVWSEQSLCRLKH